MLQIVAVAYRIRLIKPDPGANRSAYLLSTWQAIPQQAELSSLVVHTLGLMGSTDVLVVLDRALATYSAP
jgi:hypothetical protein